MDTAFRCPVYKKCGGCQLDVAYPQQLSYKMRTVIGLLGRFGHVEPILGMTEPLHYRCKVSAAFGYSRGRVLSGVWQASADKLTTVDTCALENEQATAIIQAIKELAATFKMRIYDDRTGKGFLRFVTIRVGKQTGEILVALGTGREKFPPIREFVAALTERCPAITAIVQCVSTDRFNLVLGDKEIILYGPGTITDRLCGYDFRISARSFFQINPTQTETLYSTAVALAGLDGTQTVIDAYCGVGTIGIIASAHAKSVIAAELNADAVRNAQENTALNDIRNLRVVKADAGAFMQQLAVSGEQVDVVFTDPPRAGCSRQFLSSLVALSPQKIVYISCNPETQARDLRMLTQSGYRVKRIQPVDMFPYTRHIETVVLLERKED